MKFSMRSFAFCMLCLSIFLIPTSGFAQESLGKIKSAADQYFEIGDYRQALNHYVRYDQYNGGVPHIVKRMAICQFHNNQVDKAYDNLSTLVANGRAADDREIYYYYAEALAHQNQFREAAVSYKQYLRKLRSKDPKRNQIIDKIRNCESGMDISYSKQIGFIENLGPVVNSIEDEIAPLYSRNHQDKIYYASNFDRDEANPLNAKKSFDIYSSELQEGDWANPALFPKKFSSSRDELPLAFLNQGQVMCFKRGSMSDAAILIDTFTTLDVDSLEPNFTPSNSPIFPTLGDQNFHNYGDSIILFSSKRPGGYGGYDLYFTIKNRQGWSAPKNLGSRINSTYDEVDPFLTNNAATLYFSSNRTESIGGYDIFKSRFNTSLRDWGEVVNAGRPLNSTGHDRYLQIAESGTSYVISSDRKTGYGGYDLYVIYAESPLGDMTIARGTILPAFANTGMLIKAKTDDVIPTSAPPVVDEVAPIKESQPEVNNSLYPYAQIDVASIYYSESDVVLNPQSLKELEKIASVLQKYPDLELQLFSHSAGYDGPIYFDLYFSARRAEQVLNFLNEKGVNKNKLSICGVGGQFPYARTIINGEIAGFSTKLNRRIDIVIHNGAQYNLSFNYSDGGLGDEWIDANHKKMVKLLNDISFRVEVKKASQVYKDEILNTQEFPLIEKLSNKNIYHYTVGWSTSLPTMVKLQQQLIDANYTDAKVIAYHRGMRLDNQSAEKLVEQYPVLKKYLEQ